MVAPQQREEHYAPAPSSPHVPYGCDVSASSVHPSPFLESLTAGASEDRCIGNADRRQAGPPTAAASTPPSVAAPSATEHPNLPAPNCGAQHAPPQPIRDEHLLMPSNASWVVDAGTQARPQGAPPFRVAGAMALFPGAVHVSMSRPSMNHASMNQARVQNQHGSSIAGCYAHAYAQAAHTYAHAARAFAHTAHQGGRMGSSALHAPAERASAPKLNSPACDETRRWQAIEATEGAACPRMSQLWAEKETKDAALVKEAAARILHAATQQPAPASQQPAPAPAALQPVPLPCSKVKAPKTNELDAESFSTPDEYKQPLTTPRLEMPLTMPRLMKEEIGLPKPEPRLEMPLTMPRLIKEEIGLPKPEPPPSGAAALGVASVPALGVAGQLSRPAGVQGSLRQLPAVIANRIQAEIVRLTPRYENGEKPPPPDALSLFTGARRIQHSVKQTIAQLQAGTEGAALELLPGSSIPLHDTEMPAVEEAAPEELWQNEWETMPEEKKLPYIRKVRLSALQNQLRPHLTFVRRRRTG